MENLIFLSNLKEIENLEAIKNKTGFKIAVRTGLETGNNGWVVGG